MWSGQGEEMTVRRCLCGLWLAASACDSSPASAPPPTMGVPFISVAPTGQTLAVGDSLLFHATTNGSGVAGFAWSVSSTATASINAGGWVRALSPGPVAVIACFVSTPSICGNASLTVR